MAFQQAQIPVQQSERFERLRGVIERAFSASEAEKLLRRIQAGGLYVREFEKVLEAKVFEAVDASLGQSGESAQRLYAELPLSDQALMREFYLERIELVDPRLRQRFHKVYQYY